MPQHKNGTTFVRAAGLGLGLGLGLRASALVPGPCPWSLVAVAVALNAPLIAQRSALLRKRKEHHKRAVAAAELQALRYNCIFCTSVRGTPPSPLRAHCLVSVGRASVYLCVSDEGAGN